MVMEAVWCQLVLELPLRSRSCIAFLKVPQLAGIIDNDLDIEMNTAFTS